MVLFNRLFIETMAKKNTNYNVILFEQVCGYWIPGMAMWKKPTHPDLPHNRHNKNKQINYNKATREHFFPLEKVEDSKQQLLKLVD